MTKRFCLLVCVLGLVLLFGGVGCSTRAAKQSSKPHYQTIFDAIGDGDVDSVKGFLDKHVSANSRDQNGDTPLIRAATTQRSVQVATLLLDRGADINAKGTQGYSPLHAAALCQNVDMVRCFLSRGAKVDVRNAYGETPLFVAVTLARDTKVASLLLAHGANVNSKTAYGYTPLHKALSFRNERMVRFLIEHGSRIDLPLAISLGDLEKAKNLVRDGADINAIDGLGYTPLHWAARSGYKHMVTWLIASGAKVNVRTKTKTPLRLAIEGFQYTPTISNEREDIVRLLVANGADINKRDADGMNALRVARLREYNDIADFLTQRGATE